MFAATRSASERRTLGWSGRTQAAAQPTFGAQASHGPGRLDQFQRAAVYVDRILRGAKPAELPLERPTKFELVINLKAAKALRLVIPQSVLLQADEVIQQLRISWRVPRRLAGVPNITLQRPGARDAPPGR